MQGWFQTAYYSGGLIKNAAWGELCDSHNTRYIINLASFSDPNLGFETLNLCSSHFFEFQN